MLEGSDGCGKTSIVRRLKEDLFHENYIHTYSQVNKLEVELIKNGKNIGPLKSILLRDTSDFLYANMGGEQYLHHEPYRWLQRSWQYSNNSDTRDNNAFILVLDVSKELDNRWKNSIDYLMEDTNSYLALLLTKCDEVGIKERKINQDDINYFRVRYNIPFVFEISSNTGEGIKMLLMKY